MAFPSDFVWGAASSSYQIEGAAKEDGKGLSVWDAMCARDGAIWEGHTGETACEHYHRYKADVGLMKEIGLNAYRFSVSWPRVLSGGVGAVNTKGLDFYDHLVDELLAAGITPYPTLFHWDFPLDLYRRDGWLNRDSAGWFAEYTEALAGRLSDRVKCWITINEIQVIVHAGHLVGVHAPGDKLPLDKVLQVGHNVMRAHGRAVQVIRAASSSDCSIGYAPVGVVRLPATESEADVNAAREASFSLSKEHLYNNPWWLDPIFVGEYPEEGLRIFGDAAPEVQPGDMELISQPLDFLGLNIYFGSPVRADENGKPVDVPRQPGAPLTAMNTAVTPEALYWGPKLLHERYKLPIMITENGMSTRDWIALDGKVHDSHRIDFVHRHLQHLARAISEGVDVRGYLYWSILDNFEWAEGYKERFGLIYVDFATQQRVLKDSALWYKQVIANNGSGISTP